MLTGQSLGRAVEDKRSTDVSSELSRINEIIRNQQDLLTNLENSLNPILSMNKTDGTVNTSAPEAMLVPLAADIRELRKIVEINNNRITNLLNTIEL